MAFEAYASPGVINGGELSKYPSIAPYGSTLPIDINRGTLHGDTLLFGLR
jgi:hypothetical protein